MRILMLVTALTLVAVSLVAQEDPLLGNWNLTVTGTDGVDYASWLEVKKEAGALQVRFLNRGGSPFAVKDARIEGGSLAFSFSRGNVTTTIRGKAAAGKLTGTKKVGDEPEQKFVAVRPPRWNTPQGAAAKMKAGAPVALFNEKDVSGWLPQEKAEPLGWAVKDGALDNQGKANNIYSAKSFKDFKLEVEFNVAKNSNSGIYLRGRHEIQVLDDAGKPTAITGQGAVYGFIQPSANASKPAGEWQKFEITLVGNRVTVVLNGTTIIDDREMPAITGGAMDSREDQPGPILLQGDHGPVKYRKVVVTPLN